MCTGHALGTRGATGAHAREPTLARNRLTNGALRPIGSTCGPDMPECTNMNAVADRSRETYIVGLRNQHAVENQAIELLERQVGRLENYPEMRERMQHHLEESREQARRIEDLLSGLGTSHS